MSYKDKEFSISEFIIQTRFTEKNTVKLLEELQKAVQDVPTVTGRFIYVNSSDRG